MENRSQAEVTANASFSVWAYLVSVSVIALDAYATRQSQTVEAEWLQGHKKKHLQTLSWEFLDCTGTKLENTLLGIQSDSCCLKSL